MVGFFLTILKNIVVKLATTGAFNFMMPTLLKFDKWCEDKIGLDIIKQEQKWGQKYTLLKKRIETLEEQTKITIKEINKLQSRKEENLC